MPLTAAVLVSSGEHYKLLEEAREVQTSLSTTFADSVKSTQSAKVLRARSSLTELLEKFPGLRQLKSERQKCKQKYDHYTKKVSDMREEVQKKKAVNPNYQGNSKKIQRMARNQRKLNSATDDFNAVSNKAREIMDGLHESRFSRVVPLVSMVGGR